MPDKRIIVKNVSKDFKIGFKKRQGFLGRILSYFSGREPRKIINVLENISFDIEAGKIVGIIGNNSSGKSTLLRIIAGIYKQDSGEVKTYGKVISLLNLVVGLKERLTMTDNIYLCCSLFGISRKDIAKKMNSIVVFSELEEFINTKVYQFSEGMRQRLAFSIAIHCKPDILLLDEVFEVGDEGFKQKSAEIIKKIALNGVSVILVSHELWMIKKYCDSVIWMHEGKIIQKGSSGRIVSAYTSI